jgi:hypothetical protein
MMLVDGMEREGGEEKVMDSQKVMGSEMRECQGRG